jgi:choline dehydrogenase
MESSDHASPLRGQTGPLSVSTVRRPHAVTEAYLESARAAGYAINEDYNARSQEGVSRAQLTVRRGFRCSSADAFVTPLLGRRNFTLLLHASVDKIEMTGGRAQAVLFRHKGKQVREFARDVVVCAGAINSPKLLMLSGIGDSEELARHNIDVTLRLPGVGRYFKDHPLAYLGYRTKVPTNNPTEGLLHKLAIAAKFIRYRQGPIANIWESIGFVRSSASEALPDLQILFTPVGYLKAPTGELALANYPAVTIAAVNSYPKGDGGRIRLASKHPDDPPLIEYALLESQVTVDVVIKSVEILRRIMKTEPIASLVQEEIAPGPTVEGRAALETFVRSNTGVCLHSIGSCRMGIGEDAVVSPELRVQGTENLWVADASIMPGPISANLNGPCMMIGKKLGQQLAARP